MGSQDKAERNGHQRRTRKPSRTIFAARALHHWSGADSRCPLSIWNLSQCAHVFSRRVVIWTKEVVR